MIEMTDNRYGKADVRLMKVNRDEEPHEVTELRIDIRLEGDLEEAYSEGDNTDVLPTDTMKNTVYALARSHQVTTPDQFGLLLADHFVESQPPIRRATIEIAESPWDRVDTGAGAHPRAFTQNRGERRLSRIEHVEDDTVETTAVGGIGDLVLLKSTDSGFSNFVEDQYTTLEEEDDRVLATSLEARWTYQSPNVDFDDQYERIRAKLVEVFANHDSLSVQHTLHAMGTAVLEHFPDVSKIHIEMPNKHNLPVDLDPFGKDNPYQVLKPIDEPSGVIEATLKRG